MSLPRPVRSPDLALNPSYSDDPIVGCTYLAVVASGNSPMWGGGSQHGESPSMYVETRGIRSVPGWCGVEACKPYTLQVWPRRHTYDR